MTERYAFVLTQIGAEGSAERMRTDQVTRYIIKPACKQKGLDALRADHDPTPGRITNQVVRHIVESAVVIADLTGRNANVYYELGIAHSFNRPVILLVDDPEMLVFDTKDERVIRLGQIADSLSAQAAEQGREELLRALDIVLAQGFEPTSVVTEAASVRKLDQLAPENPVYKEILAIRDDISTLGSRLSRRFSVRNSADATALRTFVERLVETNMVGPDTLKAMETPETTDAHDEWVRQMMEKHAEASKARQARARQQKSAPDDDPWASAPPPHSSSSGFPEEPPF